LEMNCQNTCKAAFALVCLCQAHRYAEASV
jgi:hypothetical protein